MNKFSLITILFLILSLQLIGQTKKNGFSSLSSPEKWWVVCHPFKAKKALEVSLRALLVTDSIKKTNTIGVDINGGKLDAFKHTFWMANLSHHIGEKASLKLGEAHEKGNYRSFLRGHPEDGFLPDKVSSYMDLCIIVISYNHIVSVTSFFVIVPIGGIQNPKLLLPK